jgi:hypothetical protein
LIETEFDIERIYNKGRQFFIMDQQVNKNIINILKYCSKLKQKYENIPDKTG